jgi:hypothetical protein
MWHRTNLQNDYDKVVGWKLLLGAILVLTLIERLVSPIAIAQVSSCVSDKSEKRGKRWSQHCG